MVATTRTAASQHPTASSPQAVPPDELLLHGVRVLDLSQDRTQMCGRYLADLGAEVILIEPPGGSASRRIAPLIGDAGVGGESLYFATHNANKLGITLDLRTALGRERLLELCAGADIVIESEAPGALDRLGVGAVAMRARNRALVVTSITDFGQDGPYRDYQGTNLVHMALTGVLARSGNAGHEPLRPPGELAYETSAIQGAWATMLAYANACASGVGDHVDVSVFETTAQTIDPGLGMGGTARAAATEQELAQRDRPDGAHIFPIMRCADGYVRFALLAPKQWRAMRSMIGEPAAYQGDEFDEIPPRWAAWADLGALIEASFRTRTRADIAEDAARRGIPLVEMVSPQEVLGAPHFAAREAFADLPIDGRTGRIANGFLSVDGARAGIRFPAPSLGQHNDVISPRPRRSAVPAHPLPDRAAPEPARPLRGVRVLDLGVIVMGAELSRLYADMGADVAKVENRAFPDGMRHLTPGGVLTPALAWGLRNKRSLGLNLRRPDGIALFLQLVGHADIVLSNFKPGTMEQLGLGFAVLRAANPAIVVAESSALGSTGPWSTRMGYGPLVRASTALTGLWRYPDLEDGFCDSGTIYPDHAAARVEAVAVLSALLRARESGVGARISAAQSETILSQLSTVFLRESLLPGSVVALGNVGEFDAPQGVYPAAGQDEWCVVEVQDDAQWRALAAAIGRAELIDDARYRTAADRLAHREDLDSLLSRWTHELTPTEVMEVLQAVGVPAAGMRRILDLLDDPHLRARGHYGELHQPQIAETLPTEKGPAHFEIIAEPVIRPAPIEGQHTREIVREWLGLNDQQIERAVAEGSLEAATG
jgi:crotonobetainyl-CoA:carnitine CoA-transferase CaiB-like acyl-CoA transferase